MSALRYAVLGHPIGHTMSPFIHHRLFALDGLSAEYSVLDVPPERLTEEERTTLRRLDGYNLTIPLKTVILPLLDSLSEKAALYGSVNTVKNGALRTGYSTDPFGFLGALEDADIALRGRVVILGCGGVARIMAMEAALAGADVTLAVREGGQAKARALTASVQKAAPGAVLSVCTIPALCAEKSPVSLLVNATPVGMYPNAEELPVGVSVLARTAAVFDAIYNPEQTLLLKTAAENGCRVCGGMRMLVLQAAQAHKIWHGSTYSRAAIDSICADAAQEMAKKFANP